MKTSSRIRLAAAVLASLLVLVGCAKPGDSLVTKAMNAYSAKDYDTALDYFTQALESETRYSDEILYGFIASVYTHQENWEQAADFQEKSLAIKPDYRGFVSLGMLRHYAGDDERAAAAYNGAIALDGTAGEAYASLGALYLGQKKAAEAVAMLEKATALSPKIALFRANLGVAYAMRGDKAASRAALDEAERLKCENIALFRERAEEATEAASTQ